MRLLSIDTWQTKLEHGSTKSEQAPAEPGSAKMAERVRAKGEPFRST